MPNMDLSQLLSGVHVATGGTVALYDAQFRTVISHNASGSYCSFLHNTQDALERCLRSDMQAFHRVQQTGEAYLYVCPFGLSTALFPLFGGKRILGYLYFGGILVGENGLERLERYVWELLRIPADNPRLRKRVARLQRTDEARFAALCDMMRVVCAYIEQNNLLSTREAGIGELTQQYILQNLQSRITLGKICLNLHCSKATLTESFRRECGMTVVQFLTQKRLERACDLLAETKLPVRRVAEECGFSGVEYFSGQFKKYYGIAPLAYRKQHAPE